MADVIGTLGTSGFIGIVLGTFIGDLVLGDGKHYELMFVLAAAIGSLAFVFGWLATDGELLPIRRRRLPACLDRAAISSRSPVMWMGVAAGFGLGLADGFLRPYARELGIEELGTFFYPYMLVAFVTRLAIRRLPALHRHPLDGADRHFDNGRRHVPVRRGPLSLATFLPAVFMGVAHACIFPAVVAGGRGEFPQRYRGVGTTAMLAMFDLGNFVGQPSFGGVWDAASDSEVCRVSPSLSAFLPRDCSGRVGYAWATARAGHVAPIRGCDEPPPCRG